MQPMPPIHPMAELPAGTLAIIASRTCSWVWPCRFARPSINDVKRSVSVNPGNAIDRDVILSQLDRQSSGPVGDGVANGAGNPKAWDGRDHTC